MYCMPLESTPDERALKVFRDQEPGAGTSFPHALPSRHAPSLPRSQRQTTALLPSTPLRGRSGAAFLIQCNIFSRPAGLILGRYLLLLLPGGSTQRNLDKKIKAYICRVAQAEMVSRVKISLCSLLAY